MGNFECNIHKLKKGDILLNSYENKNLYCSNNGILFFIRKEKLKNGYVFKFVSFSIPLVYRKGRIHLDDTVIKRYFEDIFTEELNFVHSHLDLNVFKTELFFPYTTKNRILLTEKTYKKTRYNEEIYKEQRNYS